MDNVSHTLVGAALGRAGLNRATGLATATLMIAANIPDVDVLAIPFGENLTFRRGWTHGPIGLVVLPAVLTAIMVGFDRWQSARGTRPKARLPVRPAVLLGLAYLGAFTHPFLDWLNSYGIRLLMPFSHEWYYGDALFIIDPWLWLMLSIGIVWSRRRRRAGVERPGRPAAIALGLLAIYIGLMIAGSRHAESSVRKQAAARGIEPVDDVMAGPVPVNPLRREVIIDAGNVYHTGHLDLLPLMRLHLDAKVIERNADHPDVAVAREHPQMAGFLYWSRYPFFEITPLGDETNVTVSDVRFAGRPGTNWARVSVRIPAR